MSFSPTASRRLVRSVLLALTAIVALVGCSAALTAYPVSGRRAAAAPGPTVSEQPSVGVAARSAQTANPWAASVTTPAVTTPAVATRAAAPSPSAAMPIPPGSGTGQRVVYSRTLQHTWIVDGDGTVIRQYPVSGRSDWPLPGTYHVLERVLHGDSPAYHATFNYMVVFTIGHTLPIGFHDIPIDYDGQPQQTVAQLGQAVGHGGCVHAAEPNAIFLYDWAAIGTPVVVLP